MYVCMYICMYMCMYVCMYVCIVLITANDHNVNDNNKDDATNNDNTSRDIKHARAPCQDGVSLVKAPRDALAGQSGLNIR